MATDGCTEQFSLATILMRMRLWFQGSDGPDGSNTVDSWNQGQPV